jgi:hypothetical protein
VPVDGLKRELLQMTQSKVLRWKMWKTGRQEDVGCGRGGRGGREEKRWTYLEAEDWKESSTLKKWEGGFDELGMRSTN